MFDLFYFQALAVKESRVREATRQRKTMRGREGEQGKNCFLCCDQQRKQEIEGIRLVNGRGGGRGDREFYVGYRRAD